MSDRNEYGYPTMELYQEPLTEAELVEAEYEARAAAALFLLNESVEDDSHLMEMYNYV